MAFAILPHLLREVSILSLSLNFMYVMGLRLVLQSYPRRKPYMRFLYVRPEVCPRVSMFPESGFLQIPPHDGHPCLRLYPSHHRADSGLSPVRNVRRRAHQKSANGLTIPFADLYFPCIQLITNDYLKGTNNLPDQLHRQAPWTWYPRC